MGDSVSVRTLKRQRLLTLMRVINCFGSQEALADFCDVSPQAVSEWVNRSKCVPLVHLERLSIELSVSPAWLRPDLGRILKNEPCGSSSSETPSEQSVRRRSLVQTPVPV